MSTSLLSSPRCNSLKYRFPGSSFCFLKVKGIVLYYSFHFQKDEHVNENENESYFL